jgi:putative peptidoglycan lipid II flippase
MSRITRATLLLACFFAADKIVAILRQVIIARQFGLTSGLDAFNIANNLPDMLFALFSSGALALALIPVLSEILAKEDRKAAWSLFSRIINLVFIVTASLSLIVAIFAEPLVKSQFGIAPGFSSEQQELVVKLMRMDLIATLIFSISGLVIAGLQANQHFLLPAMAPLLYNIGQIIGAVIFSPASGYQIGSITLPAFNLGIYGLVYGVILGAVMHLLIQVPGLLHFGFRWEPGLALSNPRVRQVLKLMGPRVLTVFFIQITFIARDNLASNFTQGAVSALTYGWMIQQVPETLIGTAIGTAMLPTLSEMVARKQREIFQSTIKNAIRVLVAITIPVAVILGLGLGPLVEFAFGFRVAGTELLLWVSRGFLVGLLGHSLLEIAGRSFYAHQDAVTPMLAAGLNAGLYVVFGTWFSKTLGVMGISLGDSMAFTLEALLLLVILTLRYFIKRSPGARERIERNALFTLDPNTLGTFIRSVLAGVTAGLVVFFSQGWLTQYFPEVIAGIASMVLAGLSALPLIWKECRLLLHL